jgi:hypothetical protein
MKMDNIKFVINIKEKFCINYNKIENKYFTKLSIRKAIFTSTIVIFAIAMYKFYFNWARRIGGEFYNQSFTLLGKPIFNICNTIIYIINTLFIYRICSETKKVKASLYIGINLWF